MSCYKKLNDKIPARYILCFMLFSGLMLVFLMRINLNLAIVAMVKATNDSHSVTELPETSANYDWNKFEQSVILSSFFWGYIFFQIPGGRIAELWGIKTVFSGSILINGCLALIIPPAANLHWSLLLTIRSLQGLAQGVVFPSLSAVVAKWVPPEERATFISFAIQGASLGTVISLPLCGWILKNYGWSEVFYVSGSLALVWCLAWIVLIYDSPNDHPRISHKEKLFLNEKLKQEDYDTRSSAVPWKEALTCLQFWVGVIAAIGNDWGFHMFCNFGPMYMKTALGFDLEQSSWLSSLPFLCQYLFANGFAAFCDALIRRNVSILSVRKLSVIVSHLIPALGMLVLSLGHCDIVASVVTVTISVSAIGAISCGFFQNPLDIAPNYAGSLTGFTNTIGALTAVISTPLTGSILQASKSPEGWQIIFGLTAVIYILTSIPYLLLANGRLQPWNQRAVNNKESIPLANQN